MIHIENLVKRYGDLVALNHLSLDIHEGEIFGAARTERLREDNCYQLSSFPFEI